MQVKLYDQGGRIELADSLSGHVWCARLSRSPFASSHGSEARIDASWRYLVVISGDHERRAVDICDFA